MHTCYFRLKVFKMFTQIIQVFLLLLCLYTTSGQILKHAFQSSNSEYKLPNQYVSSKTISANQAENWQVLKRTNILNVISKTNFHTQGQHKALYWLAEDANFNHKHQQYFVASPEIFASQYATLETVTSQAVASTIVASQSAAPEIMKSKVAFPNIVESQASIPDIEARQAANTEIMPSKAMAPERLQSGVVVSELMGSQAAIQETVASQTRTPEIVAIKATTPEIVSSQSSTPEIVESRALTFEIVTRQSMTLEAMASQAETPERVTSQAKTTELKETQAVISDLGSTQTFALTDVTVTPGKHASNNSLCKHRAIKDLSSELNPEFNCTINLTEKKSNNSELSQTYNSKAELEAIPTASSEFKPQLIMTSEQNMTQLAITNLSATVVIDSESNITHEKVEFKLDQESSSKYKAKQKLTNIHKDIHVQESSSKSTKENALNSNTELVNAINERVYGDSEAQQFKNTTERILTSRDSISTMNHNQYLLSKSRSNKNASKYSNCRLLIKDKSVILLCRNLSLTYIPKTVQKIDCIIFEYNNITTVTIETFSNISEPEYLENLTLNYDNIHNISSNALDTFVNLVYLQLSGNPFYYDNLKYLLGAVSKLDSLRYLIMEDVHTITIQYDLFSLMAGTKIDVLILKRFNLGSFSLDVLKHFSRLRKLALSKNNITKIKLYKFSHLGEMFIDVNQLRTVPNFCFKSGNRSVPYFSRLYLLTLRNNMIIEVKKDSFKCLPTVELLQLGINLFNVLPNSFLRYMLKLNTLEITNEIGPFIKIEPFAFRSNSLRVLRMGSKSDALSMFSSLNDTFKWAPNIKILTIEYISMFRLTNENFQQLFGPLIHILYLKCFGCKITLDPKVILSNKPDLNYLDLRNNLIQTLSNETFSHNKKLKILNMRYNKIGHLQESALPMTLLNNLEKFDLSGNPFTCDCNLQWLIKWLKMSMKSDTNVTLHYPDGYECSNPADKENMKISEVHFSYHECHPWSPWIWFAVVGCPSFVVIGIISIVVYKNRWNIKHYIYMLRKRRNYQLIHGQNYEYDAFVGYEADDSAWVRHNLLPVLEDGEGLKLCIHERDFLAGIFINDNIVSSMDKSKKIILILTNTFARSDWCMFELKVAHSMLIENRTDVVVILLQKIDARNMNHSLKLLFETTTYIEWTEDPVGRELFWNKLKDAVKK